MDTHKDMDVNIPKPGRQAEVGPVGEDDRGCSKGNDDGAPNKCCCCTREDKVGLRLQARPLRQTLQKKPLLKPLVKMTAMQSALN